MFPRGGIKLVSFYKKKRCKSLKKASSPQNCIKPVRSSGTGKKNPKENDKITEFVALDDQPLSAVG